MATYDVKNCFNHQDKDQRMHIKGFVDMCLKMIQSRFERSAWRFGEVMAIWVKLVLETVQRWQSDTDRSCEIQKCNILLYRFDGMFRKPMWIDNSIGSWPRGPQAFILMWQWWQTVFLRFRMKMQMISVSKSGVDVLGDSVKLVGVSRLCPVRIGGPHWRLSL